MAAAAPSPTWTQRAARRETVKTTGAAAGELPTVAAGARSRGNPSSDTMSNLPTLPFSIDFRVIYIGYMGQLGPWARLDYLG
jgi:hypothetical protein